MSDQPPSGQPPPSYTPPDPNSNNRLIPPQGNQQRKNILAGINPRIWVGAVIGIVVIVVLLLLASQPRGTDGVNPTQIALEQTSTQNAIIFITQTFSAITPTIDAQVVALQTQNALQAQALTDQAATNQAIALLPTQTAVVITSPPQVVIEPTKPPQIITATPLPPTAQPTQGIIFQPSQTPTVIVTTAPPPTARCSPSDVASLPARPDATINNTTVTTQVRDSNTCIRPLFYNETGIAKGANYTLDLPEGWAVITASVTAEIQAIGGQAHQYLETPVIVIHGPFKGGVGLYEGAIRAVPEEWVQALLADVLVIQRQQTNKEGLKAITFSEK